MRSVSLMEFSYSAFTRCSAMLAASSSGKWTSSSRASSSSAYLPTVYSRG